MPSGMSGSSKALALSCAAAAWGVGAFADEASSKPAASIATSAMADLAQSPEALAAETRDLPLNGEAINLYNPKSKLAPKADPSPAAASVPVDSARLDVKLELASPPSTPGSSDWLSQFKLPLLDQLLDRSPAPESTAATADPTASGDPGSATMTADNGAGGGGGGGSSNVGTFALPDPVARTSTAASTALTGSFAAQTFSAAVTTSPLAAPPTRSPVITSPTLPDGVLTYNTTILDLGGFVSSQVNGMATGQSVGYLQDASGTNIHAAYWPSAGSAVRDLHPLGGKYVTSHALGIGGSQIVGVATAAVGQNDHAYLWTIGQGTNGTDLNPLGYKTSYAKATNGFLQVGYGYLTLGYSTHALAWTGSATGFTDMNPLTFFGSEALGISGNLIVGYGEFFDTSGVELHAMLWNGVNNTPTDINPTTITLSDSHATAINGTLIGGYGTIPSTGAVHAIMWTNTNAASAVDLNPRGYYDSEIVALNSTLEVGFGHVSSEASSVHALLWEGSSGNFLDLSQYLPSNFTSAVAEGIDAAGNVTGYALNTTTGYYQAVQWSPVAYTPEPGAAISLMALGAGWGIGRRRRHRS